MTPPNPDPTQIRLPPYTYIPGVTPHPINDPQGHSFGVTHPECAPPTWQALPTCELFQRGLQLFNAGYYWEAHEAWEGVWIAAGRTGLVADFVKGLIKLAAAGVKLREGSSGGAERHLRRSEELLVLTKSRLSTALSPPLGCDIEQPVELVKGLRQGMPAIPPGSSGLPVVLLGQL